LPPRANAELDEHLAQVPFDRVGADEELGADLLVGQAVPSEPRDEGLLLRELTGGIDGALAYGRAGGQQFAASSLGETVHAHGGEHLVGSEQLATRIGPAISPAEPLPVQQVSAGQLRAHPGPAEMLDSLPEPALGDVWLAEQGSRAGLDTERPVGSARPCLPGPSDAAAVNSPQNTRTGVREPNASGSSLSAPAWRANCR